MTTSLLQVKKIAMLCAFFFCCMTVKSTAVSNSVCNTLLLKEDPLPARKIINKFLQWYKVNLHKANSFAILTKESAGNYMIDKTACTAYLNFIKSSKCISAKYIAYWQTYFDDKAIELQQNPIQSDIPEGFDFDFVLVTQEPDIVLNQLSSVTFKTISINNEVAIIGLKWPGKDPMEYEFEMYKTKDGWQIGYISTPNYD